MTSRGSDVLACSQVARQLGIDWCGTVELVGAKVWVMSEFIGGRSVSQAIGMRWALERPITGGVCFSLIVLHGEKRKIPT